MLFRGQDTSVPSPKSLGLRCVENGPPARREEGASLKRNEPAEQRCRRPIFNATLWAAAGWLFFRVARSARIDPDRGASLAHCKTDKCTLAKQKGVSMRVH